MRDDRRCRRGQRFATGGDPADRSRNRRRRLRSPERPSRRRGDDPHLRATDRVRFAPGDFFTEITADAECYLLRQIIHDWEDDDAITILRTCRRAIAPGGRLLIIELILPPQGTHSLEAVMIDVTMLVRLGGRERTETQYATLLEEAGFNLDRVITTSSRQAILECTPAA
jgi:hypothetical protein